MKELFSDKDTYVLYRYKSILSINGIDSFVKNEGLMNMVGVYFDMYPSLCVTNDKDYDKAIEIIKEESLKIKEEYAAQSDAEDVCCKSCNEMNPANFEICWSCQKLLN